MTQDERRIKALDPGYVKIDDRKISDFLKFMSDFAGQVNFYNEKDKIDSDWQDFFTSDKSILILLITKFDLTSHLIQFEKLEAQIHIASGDKEALEALRNLFAFLHKIIEVFNSTCKRLEYGNNFDKVSLELGGIIKGLSKEISEIIAYNKQAERHFGEPFAFLHPEELIDLSISVPEIFSEAEDIKLRILPALSFIKETFTNLRSKYHNFLAVTAFYYKDYDILKNEYPPHISLCITFLKLFEHLINQINKLSSEHLDFYFKKVLELQLNTARPDSVHIVFDSSSLDRVVLERGEQLQAEVDSNLLFYAIDEDMVVTKAKIPEIRTLILDEHTQVISPNPDDQDVKEIEIYKSSYKNIPADRFFEQQSGIKPWPVLGESQFELSDDDRTMEDTEIGILLASPVLYQPEGHRSVLLTIYFEQTSFTQLIQYFKNYANVTGKLLQTVSYELLSDAFVISFTSSTAWVEVKRYTVKINLQERNFEIKFELSPVDKGIDIYRAEIHGENYEAEWPIVKLILNNYSTHNPFSFFRKLLIHRVTITANVSGSRAVKLQNNIGNLSADNPFHPFGPQPVIGSYLDIKNTNIFNRYTRDFCIKMEWIDLPRVSGGWATYLKEYHANITNDSFKVKLSGLSQGKFKPPLSKRQEFNLFTMDRGDFGSEILSEVSQIRDVDLKRLELPNRPLLNKEGLVPDANFTEGAVRLEFSAPEEAFGSKLYPQIFPETVLHNSKRFSKKRPLPNPPNIPVVRSITVDYTLEHSEVLIKTAKNEDSGIKIIHQYPFGYENVYPESDKQPYNFIPDFEFENNLYIGIEDLYPKQELSLLFQLQETNFSDHASEPEPIVWSYLYDNSWIILNKGEVLYDTTSNFINTGIVRIRMPEDVQNGNTRILPNLYWLRASSRGKSSIRSKMTGVYPHALTATRIIDYNSQITDIRLPPNTIKSFRNKLPGINGINQIFSSFGGRPAETIDQYYIRVSERLRHKNRMVTNRDIEQAILEEFPQVLMAKSISPELSFTRFHSPGNRKIRVIIVPKEANESFFTNNQPRVNLADLYKIKKFVKAGISPFVDIEIENPVYEKIKLIGKVKFGGKQSGDIGHYMQKLNEDIRRYLCPWLYESSSSFKIGSQIYVSELLNYIKKRPYVDYLTGFSVLHFFNWNNERNGETLSGMNDLGRNKMNFLRGSVPEAVLIPSDDHMFTIMDEAEYSDPVEIGISNLAISQELIVYDKVLSPDSEETTASAQNLDENEYINLFISHNIK
ncbi:hypothetical protein [Daejeonella sp.]|uniref:hypothetical protein n=1 Tax=Daejeonella sp. TaxID=2805397 RepID=UPI002734936A|nr:hypothetical protein [Daejeonella sp.]